MANDCMASIAKEKIDTQDKLKVKMDIIAFK
jgi:hypothetical protein